jgi:pyruvate/2-oxoglutarate/acetoin dehydrogenase E1 component/TPP-dependent pyruvate/acetoin dehydrogenase alpha subunit
MLEMTKLTDETVLDLPPLTDQFIEEVKHDFWICCVSREMSLIGRREVLTGKAKFGIFGDGKEVPQVAMARAFQKGDWRSGYYRDQTIVLALGIATIEDLFAQLYADSENDPFSKGRQMNAHFATPTVDENGQWLDTTTTYNSSSDISCTAGQMPRGLGLALASKMYKEHQSDSAEAQKFSRNGQSVCFCTIGDASTSEGVFWETLNAAGVMQVPLAVSVWDDGYGISVPTEYQTTKGSISTALAGFDSEEAGTGMRIHISEGWDYLKLREMYEKGIARIRQTHQPALFHVTQLTQPQGHSTSGSHERYKKPERLDWEAKYDCLVQMEKWMIATDIADEAELTDMRKRAKKHVREARDRALANYTTPIQAQKQELLDLYAPIIAAAPADLQPQLERHSRSLAQLKMPHVSDMVKSARRLQYQLLGQNISEKNDLAQWLAAAYAKGHEQYHTDLYSHSDRAATNITEVKPTWSSTSSTKSGYQILNRYFDLLFARDERVLAFGEDVGHIGDVNQGFAGLQDKYGKERIFDTGIREWTIMGQAIGLAMRGWRPIAEIQYLDYLTYGLEPLTDDLATLRYRSGGIQQAPAIIRTRGHRLEGIWHSGSPLGMMVNSLRGMCVLVPRNMTQAVGFYNTMMQSDDPAIIVEPLNGYRLKEREPDNIGSYTVPVGKVETLHTGTDITLVTYGSCVRIAEEAINLLKPFQISVELIDVQSLLPFDLDADILTSIQKTNRLLVLDEDVPGGASAYILQQVLEEQDGYRYLDSKPTTLTAKAHRPPYGSDGDYFTKPNAEDIFDAVYEVMQEAYPDRFGG